MSEVPIRVLVADDHAMVREGIRSVLEREGFQVVGEATNGTEVLPLAEAHQPDVAVLDISMPGETGLQAAARLRHALPHIRVLILSMYDNTEYVLESVRAGAHGYLLKDGAAQELANAIRTVLGGEAYFSPAVAARLSEAVRGDIAREQRNTQPRPAHRPRARGARRHRAGPHQQGDRGRTRASRTARSRRTVKA